METVDPLSRSNSLPPVVKEEQKISQPKHISKAVNQSRPGLPPPHPALQDSTRAFVPPNQLIQSTVSTPTLIPPSPPPPPPPPPPKDLGIVAKSGPGGVPFIGKKPVRHTITLAEIRSNQEVLPEEAAPPVQQQQQPTIVPVNHSQIVVTPTMMFNEQSSMNLDDLNETFNEFEEQRLTMLSPAKYANYSHLRTPEFISGNKNTPHEVNSLEQMALEKSPWEALPKSTPANDIQSLPLHQIPLPVANYSNSNNFTDKTWGVSHEKKNILHEAFVIPTTNESEIITPNTGCIRHVTVKAEIKKPNDDIDLSCVRENSVPRNFSLQKDFEAQNPMNRQKSYEIDELASFGTVQPVESNHTSVRYRPPSPGGITPVKFTLTPKVGRRNAPVNETVDSTIKFYNPIPSSKIPLQSQPNLPPSNAGFTEQRKGISTKEENANVEGKVSNAPSRNISDSGISDSLSPEPDEFAGKIITEQMQKIEAQMKKIIEAENASENRKTEPSSSVSSFTQDRTESKRNSLISNPADLMLSNYSTMSGYSTCSEEELKFEEPKADIALKTAPFEIMEEFEEAPEEFDLGISSYSIAHPIEETMETTPVNDVNDYDLFNNNSTTSDKKEKDTSIYRFTAPKEPVLKSDKIDQNQKQTANNTCHVPSINQESFFGPSTPLHSHFVHPQFPTFNQSLSLDSMPPMFDQFPTLPSMFDSGFSSNPFMNSPFHALPVSMPIPKTETEESERVIPIQVINSPYKPKQNNQVFFIHICMADI